ncbi:MAG TPA: hypothetical protein VJJ47_02550 [Candidatus Paceibacterota bacterium]
MMIKHRVNIARRVREADHPTQDAYIEAIRYMAEWADVATGGAAHVEFGVVNFLPHPPTDCTRIGNVNDGALNAFRSVNVGKRWWHFHMRLTVLNEWGDADKLGVKMQATPQPAFSVPQQRGSSRLPTAFEAELARATGSPLPVPPPPVRPPPRAVGRISPHRARSTPQEASPKVPLGDAPKEPKRRGRPPKAKVKVAGVLPLNLADAETVEILAMDIREGGMGKGEWHSDETLADAIKLGIVSLCDVDAASLSDDWVRLVKNKLRGEDLVAEVQSGDTWLWQLVLSKEKVVPFDESLAPQPPAVAPEPPPVALAPPDESPQQEQLPLLPPASDRADLITKLAVEQEGVRRELERCCDEFERLKARQRDLDRRIEALLP